MSTELARLAAARPEYLTRTETLLSTDERGALLDTIMQSTAGQSARRRTGSRRRWVIGSVTVATATVALIVVSGLLPENSPGGPGRASAATLERLAKTAAGGPVVGPHQFNFVWVVSSGRTGNAKLKVTDIQQEWTAPTGQTWGYVVSTNPAQTFCVHRPAGSGERDLEGPSAAYLATIPTNPARLASYLRAHVTGATSTDEAVFFAVGDILRTGLPSPALRAAAFRVLEHTGHITVTPNVRDAQGRRTVRVDFVDPAHRPGETKSLYFDPSTSRIMEESHSGTRHTFSSMVTVRADVVDSVPAALIACASNPHNHGLGHLPVH